MTRRRPDRSSVTTRREKSLRDGCEPQTRAPAIWPMSRREAGTDSHYAGRAFGLRYSDRSRVTLFGGMNNTNVYNDRPGENGELPEESLTNGEFVTRQTGGEFFWQNKAKGIENSLTANAEWRDRDVNRKSATEAYLQQKPLHRSPSLQDVDYMGVNANNWLTWKTKDHLLTVHSYVGYDRTDTHGYARDAAFDADPSAVGGIDEVLRFRFSPSLVREAHGCAG